MPLRWTLAGDEVCLVIAVKVHLISPITELLTLLEFVDDVRITGGGNESREPVEVQIRLRSQPFLMAPCRASG